MTLIFSRKPRDQHSGWSWLGGKWRFNPTLAICRAKGTGCDILWNCCIPGLSGSSERQAYWSAPRAKLETEPEM